MKLLHFLSLLFALLFAGNAFAAAEFQIVSFDLSENFVSLDVAGSVNVDAIVNIRNIGEDAGDATIEVVVKDSKGVVIDTGITSSLNLASGASDSLVLSFVVLGTWDVGIYTFYANVGDGVPPLHDQKLRTLTLAVIKPPPVPEFPWFLVPLAAFSVLAFLFFAGKKHSSKL